MSRPKLSLTDDQARSLVAQIEPIIQRHAHEPRQHRPFVHDFLRAVYHATGQTYSPAFYRKLLSAYAPGRTPSTPTIESEKLQLVHELKLRGMPREVIARIVDAPESAPAPQAPPAQANPGTNLALQQLLALQHHLIALINGNGAATAPAAAVSSVVPSLQAHNDYLRERLASLEAELATTRTTSARLAASVQEEASLAAERGRALNILHKAASEQAAALAAMATELTGTRNFAMQAVDGVRGETRAVRERCSYLEAQLKDKEQQLEMYRRMAFSKGTSPALPPGMAR
jgi:DNA-binding transcriptional MerR regulator